MPSLPRVLATISETTVLSIISFVALIGNVSLFFIVYKNRSLHTINNIFILNLAAADILVSALSMPVTVVTIIKQRWVFGDTACTALGFLTILSFIASVMSLGMIAINRYYYIVKWNTYNDTFTKRKALLYGVAVWVFSISLALPPHFGWGKYRFIPGKSYCFVDWTSNIYYSYFLIAVCFLGPLSAMVFSYYNILKFTSDSKRKVSALRNNLTAASEVRGPTTTDETRQKNSPEITVQYCDIEEEESKVNMGKTNNLNNEPPCDRVQKIAGQKKSRKNFQSKPREFEVTREEARITNTFLLVVVAFLICWAPFVVTMFFDMYQSRPLPRAVDIISLLLGYLNSVVNPILYGVRNSALRQGFSDLYSRFIPKPFRSTNQTRRMASQEGDRNRTRDNLEAGNELNQM